MIARVHFDVILDILGVDCRDATSAICYVNFSAKISVNIST